jgi:pilus assembly protein CpaD
MSKRFTLDSRAWLAPALLLVTSSVLSGCVIDQAGDYVDPNFTAYYERYPIHVVTAPVKMGVAAHAGMLQPDQMNAVANFARDARYDSHSRIAIRWPSASGTKGRKAATDAAAVMVNQGVPQEMISIGSYRAAAGAPLELSYERKVAVTRECGNWDDNLGHSPLNDEYSNFGCAYQNNIAAMVADAEDFDHPRAESPIVAANRVKAMQIYFGSATDVTSQDQTVTSNKSNNTNNNNGGTSGN